MTNNLSKPQIRFKGFTEAWEQRKLKDESNYIVAGGDVDKSKLKESGSYPVIANALTNDGIVGYYASEFRIDAPAVTVTGRGEVGYAVARKCNFTPIVRLLSIKTSHDVDFLANNINLKGFVVESTGVPQLTVPKLEDLLLYFPKQISEEIHIGNMFVKINNLITLHQRKYEKLQQIKKSLLAKMFPAEGDSTPKIRFKGFTEAWEQRKLGDIVQITMGQSPDGTTYSDTPSDYILVQGNADLVDGWVSPRIWTTQKTKTCSAGDLIMSVRAPAGTMGKTAYNAVIGRGVASIKGNEFVFQQLSKMDNDGFWKKDSSGSTFESLNSDSIKNAEISLPREVEQVKIGSLFKNLDHLITLHQRKCEMMKNIKKTLLDKMFA